MSATIPTEIQILFLVKEITATPAMNKRQNQRKYETQMGWGSLNWPIKTIPILPRMMLPRKPIIKSRIFFIIVCVSINDLSFVPGDLAQAEDRAYRYGQKNSVSVYYPIFDNSIEGIIYDMVNQKKQNIGTVMGDNLEEKGDFISNIMNKINNRG